MRGSSGETSRKYSCCPARGTLWLVVECHVWDIVIACLGHFESSDRGLPHGIKWDILRVFTLRQAKTGGRTCRSHGLGHCERTQGATVWVSGLVH